MTWSKAEIDELVLQARIRAEKIAVLEEELEQQRGLRAADARFLARNTDLTRSAIAELLGVSRMTLHEYLKHEKRSDQESAGEPPADDKDARIGTSYHIDAIPVGKNRAD